MQIIATIFNFYCFIDILLDFGRWIVILYSRDMKQPTQKAR